MAAIAAMSLLACHGAHDDHDHDHDHDTDEHETTKADAHDEHGTDDIHFTDAQAKACNLKVETLQPSTFAEVVHVSGRVLPAQGAEATVTATMPGIVSFTGKSLTEGVAVNAGKTMFVIDAQQMADGNPAAVAQSEAKAAKLAEENGMGADDHTVMRQRRPRLRV